MDLARHQALAIQVVIIPLQSNLIINFDVKKSGVNSAFFI